MYKGTFRLSFVERFVLFQSVHIGGSNCTGILTIGGGSGGDDGRGGVRVWEERRRILLEGKIVWQGGEILDIVGVATAP